MRAVEFLGPARVGTLYGAGEVAAFDAATAEGLVEAGLAREVAPPKKAAEPPKKADGGGQQQQ